MIPYSGTNSCRHDGGDPPRSPDLSNNAIPQPNQGDVISPDLIFLNARPLPGENTIRLSWIGKSREDLATTLEAARRHHQEGEIDQAENCFIEAYKGFESLLSSTHHETVQVAYNCAGFYAQQGRKLEADEILEELTQKHINQLGIGHPKTRQHILNVVELLNGWSRECDALAFLSRAKDIAEVQNAQQHNDRVEGHKYRRERQHERRPNNAAVEREIPQELNVPLDRNVSPETMDYTLSIAKAYVAANEPAVEAFLKAMTATCARDSKKFVVKVSGQEASFSSYT